MRLHPVARPSCGLNAVLNEGLCDGLGFRDVRELLAHYSKAELCTDFVYSIDVHFRLPVIDL